MQLWSMLTTGVKNDSCTVMIMGVLYRVQFNDMTAVAVLPSAGKYPVIKLWQLPYYVNETYNDHKYGSKKF